MAYPRFGLKRVFLEDNAGTVVFAMLPKLRMLLVVADKESPLDADVLESVLDGILPSKNKERPEPYAQLIDDLFAFDLRTVADVRALLSRHKAAVLFKDAECVARESKKSKPLGTSKERLERGVYYSHVGLLRTALGLEFADKWRDYNRETSQKRKKTQ